MITFDYHKIVEKGVWVRCYNVEQATHLLKWAKWNYFKMENGEDIDIDNLYWDYSNRFMAYSFNEGKVAIKSAYDESLDIIEYCDSISFFFYSKEQESLSVKTQGLSSKKYKFVKNMPNRRYYEVTIEADYNDSDYIKKSQRFYQEEFDEVVDDIIDLKNNYSGRHELDDYESDRLDIPYSEDGDKCHTLMYINIIMYDTDGYSYIVEI